MSFSDNPESHFSGEYQQIGAIFKQKLSFVAQQAHRNAHNSFGHHMGWTPVPPLAQGERLVVERIVHPSCREEITWHPGTPVDPDKLTYTSVAVLPDEYRLCFGVKFIGGLLLQMMGLQRPQEAEQPPFIKIEDKAHSLVPVQMTIAMASRAP